MENINFHEFEVLLQKMKEEMESSISRLNDEMEAITTEDEINDREDLASLKSDNMHHTALLKQQQHELDEVNHALSKIKNGTYGICEESGDTISLERLRVEPHTRYCLDDAKKAEH